MSDQHTRPCWYRTRKTVWNAEMRRRESVASDPMGGTFHLFGQEHTEYDSGPGPYMVAIVED